MSEAIHMSPTEFRASQGKFDASKRYLRAGSSGSFFPIPRGPTLDVYEDGLTVSSTGQGTVIRYHVHSYSAQRTDVATGTFSADVTLTTL